MPSQAPRGVVVTGASSGIGRACALELDKAGYRVFATVRQEKDAESLKQSASALLTPVMMDVTNEGSIVSAANAVAEQVGADGLAGLVNNAGVGVPGPMELISLDDLRGGLSQFALQRWIAPVRRTRHEWLELGCACTDTKAAAFCANVWAVELALGTFGHREGVEPTTNPIERLRRSGVRWRKNALGCQREGGGRFGERILTVVQTRRLPKRPVLGFLYPSLRAHREARQAPRLVAGA